MRSTGYQKTGFLLKGLAFLLLCLFLVSCTFPARSGYDRKIGAYKPAPSAQQKAAAKQAAKQSGTKTASANSAQSRSNDAAKQRQYSSLEDMVKSWLGTPYVWGGASRSGTDCSGYVMNLYKDYYGISISHKASMIYDDSRATKVSRDKLKEGDLVFFGNFFKITHVGIYLSDDRFSHASSSRGVIISKLSEKYYAERYKGARRF